MKVKSVDLDSKMVKAGPQDGLEEGEFLVYPSTFTREPDSYGDVVSKGAFIDSIQKWKDAGDVMPGMYLHDPNQIVAEATDMGEDDHGWWVKGRFDDDPEAQKVYKWLKGRRLSSLSFGYQTKEEGKVKLANGKSANELRKVEALEFSFLPKGFAANPDASVVAVKRLAESVTAGDKAGLTVSKKNETALRDARDAIDSVLNALSEEGGNKDQEEANANAEAKSGANTEEPSPVNVPVPDDERKPEASVKTLAAKFNTYAAAYGCNERSV